MAELNEDPGTGLVEYDKMLVQINNAETADEAKLIKDQGRLMQVLAQQAHNRKAEGQAATIRIRAERRLGQILKKQDMHKGGRPRKTTRPEPKPVTVGDGLTERKITLDEVGITRNQSSEAQALAGVPDKEFEEALDVAKATNEVPSASGILAGVKSRDETARLVQMDDKVMEFIAILKVFADIDVEITDSLDLITKREVHELVFDAENTLKRIYMRTHG